MRFSAAFTLPLPLPATAQAEAGRAQPRPAAAQAAGAPEREFAPGDLPDDLDARVRLVGEWQLGESD
jgi:hypothetical protein